ncbi:ExbD/TolR family protein [Rehaibacterium terrae]|jgi:biopolymer transport protein ExbD|uniref:Biopolymer transport protein ExbD n=1 Tax=Rehaibacterium terrae TaxID=1341696 RepID=A0A7W7XZZ3_9GAMM|nr:biopolymer transporter ExbD [Rehaibacterium terrae]MBB5015545.1 biopolymer transport protein ExbD [Rehaibacterium terrae]
MAFRSTGDTPRAEINIVPLIDVLLVLLIIFMVSAPLAIQRIPLELPYRSIETSPPPDTVLRLRIAADTYWLDGAPLPPSALQERLRQVVGRAPDARLQLATDHDSEYQTLSFALAAARNAGLTAIDVE